MKKKILIRFILLSTSLVLIACLLVCNYLANTSLSRTSYKTPQEAIETALKSTEYDYVISDKGCLAVCKTSVNNYSTQLLYKKDTGWVILNGTDVGNPFYYKIIDKSTNSYVKITKYFDDYLVMVCQCILDENNTTNYFVDDSLGVKKSEFKTNILPYVRNCWFWYLDEIPEDYIITVNNEDLKIT